jgi:guanosine-3',5'-bis(diphosphate) 3'-pyrophosphohydrolase
LANAEADIVHVDMDDEAAMGTVDLRLTIKARDQAHIENVLRNLRRTPSVLRTQRVLPQ